MKPINEFGTNKGFVSLNLNHLDHRFFPSWSFAITVGDVIPKILFHIQPNTHTSTHINTNIMLQYFVIVCYTTKWGDTSLCGHSIIFQNTSVCLFQPFRYCYVKPPSSSASRFSLLFPLASSTSAYDIWIYWHPLVKTVIR